MLFLHPGCWQWITSVPLDVLEEDSQIGRGFYCPSLSWLITEPSLTLEAANAPSERRLEATAENATGSFRPRHESDGGWSRFAPFWVLCVQLSQALCSVTTHGELVRDHAGIILSWIFTSANQGAIYKFIFIFGESVCEMVTRITKIPTYPMASWTFRTVLVILESPFHKPSV